MFVEESLTGKGPLKIVNSFVCSVIIVENIETQELPTSASLIVDRSKGTQPRTRGGRFESAKAM